MKLRFLVLCNAMDDEMRARRGITTDSAAASRKVFLASEAIANEGVRPIVLSLGRGRVRDGRLHHDSKVTRRGRTIVIYHTFTRIPLISYILSSLAPIISLVRLRRRKHKTTIVFYNQLLFYVPAVIVSRLLGFRCILDLEDAPVPTKSLAVRSLSWLTSSFFSVFCDRALLAASYLSRATKIRPAIPYYGYSEREPTRRNWQRDKLQVFLGGWISTETGAERLLGAIKLIQKQPRYSNAIEFHICGTGPMIQDFTDFSQANIGSGLHVHVHGRLPTSDYDRLLKSSHVGLALKHPSGILASTTFPSKVLEISGSGALVVTTDISDVRAVLEEGARYVYGRSPAVLAKVLIAIANDRASAQETASLGALRVSKYQSPEAAGRLLKNFCFPDYLT